MANVYKLSTETLELLRDKLQSRGQRPSMLLPTARVDLIEALQIVEEYGAMCEVMYLMAAADNKVLNVEREVMRGALDVLSNGLVRTAHMEAMIDSSSRRIATKGADGCLEASIDALANDPVRAETTMLLAAAVAAADGEVSSEEEALLTKLASGLGISEARAKELLEQLVEKL